MVPADVEFLPAHRALLHRGRGAVIVNMTGPLSL